MSWSWNLLNATPVTLRERGGGGLNFDTINIEHHPPHTLTSMNDYKPPSAVLAVHY